MKRLHLTGLVRVCPGGRHGWYSSSVGLVRKPLDPALRGEGWSHRARKKVRRRSIDRKNFCHQFKARLCRKGGG